MPSGVSGFPSWAGGDYSLLLGKLSLDTSFARDGLVHYRLLKV